MEIRKSTLSDLGAILALYAGARQFMAENGNPRQWAARSWPPEQLIRQDIQAGKSYVCQENNEILAVFYFDHGHRIDPTYAHIEGQWLGDDDYGVVHRIAVAAPGRGVGAFCINWAYGQCGHLRIDTHRDNAPMQALLRRLGFRHCGTIYVAEDSDPRLAFEKVGLPASIQQHIGPQDFTQDAIGKSDSQVLLFENMVLKIRRDNTADAQMLQWLQGKLPVPKLLAREKQGGLDYLLMSRCPGAMSCDDSYKDRPDLLIKLLAQGLRQLWQVDISDCPADQRLQYKLAQAAQRVQAGLVDIEDSQPDTYGPQGFRDPEELLAWLTAHQPREELVLSHGDYCLPNVFFQGDRLSGLIDFDRCGIADKWCDIALCVRSLQDNFGGHYGPDRTPLSPDTLFQALGIEPDWEKIRYYILLDELF